MFIGLDLGTASIKALLTECDGQVVARASAPVSLRHVGEVGVEQDVEEHWQAILKVLKALGEQADLSSVKAIGVSAQGGATQFLNENDEPTGPILSWLDGRGAKYAAPLVKKLGSLWFEEHTGHAGSGMTVGQLLRLREEEPDWFQPYFRVAYVGDIIVGRLCGRRAHDGTSLGLAFLYNPSLRQADPELLNLIDLSEDQLPDLLSAREMAGELLPDVAEALSLPAGIPISPAVHDQYASALGGAVVAPGDLMLGTGTAWVLLAVTEQLTHSVIDGAFVCTHPAEGLYGQMLSMVNGGSSFGWAVKLLGLAEKSGPELDALMNTVPAGSDGLTFWPLLVAGGGVGLPPGTCGRLDGLRLSHATGHVLRAVVEGLACELVRHVRIMAEGGIVSSRLVMCGGAAISSVTPRIVADVTGLPVSCVTESAMSALGGAVLAHGLIEPGRTLAEIAKQMTVPACDVEPGADAGRYAELLEAYVSAIPRAAS